MYTIEDQIVTIQIRLASINAKIDKSEQFKAIEEGSSTARFRTEFSNNASLYAERDKLQIQLTTLQMSQLCS